MLNVGYFNISKSQILLCKCILNRDEGWSHIYREMNYLNKMLQPYTCFGRIAAIQFWEVYLIFTSLNACFVVSELFVLSSSLRSLSSLNSHKEYKLSVLRVFYTEAGYNHDYWVSKFLIYSIKSPRLRGLSSWNYELKVRR